MKILSASQTRKVDEATLWARTIYSIDLMEQAARTFTEWFVNAFPNTEQPVLVVCGPGKNGGDGLAIARMLSERFYNVQVWICNFIVMNRDTEYNLERLQLRRVVNIKYLSRIYPRPYSELDIDSDAIVIDAVFGTGLNKPLDRRYAQLIERINKHTGSRVAVDIPSGLYADKPTTGLSFMATHTLSFEFPKLAFLIPENCERVGLWSFASIGLDEAAIEAIGSPWNYQTPAEATALIRPRPKYGHKGSFGHALLVAGSYGKNGAALLGARACLRSGCGLLTVHVPRCAYEIMQIGFPEAMVSVDEHQYVFTQVLNLKPYAAIGVGPGLGTTPLSGEGLRQLLQQTKVPLVLDADALNLLAIHPDWLETIPPGSILTPHPGEFARLFGETNNHFERLERLRAAAQTHQCVLLLKGAHTAIALPNGQVYFNCSGNAGMATAGSGDVLTGILLSLLTQGYPADQAARLGVYLHGRAGDLAASDTCQESLIASDLIDHLGLAFKNLV